MYVAPLKLRPNGAIQICYYYYMCMCAWVSRLEKLAEVFYTYVGDVQMIASVVELDTEAVDMVYHYWLLKRKVFNDHLMYFD